MTESTQQNLPTNQVIVDILGKNHPVPIGWQILVQTYNFGDNFVTTDGQVSLLERPDISKERDNYQLSVGRILMIGSAAFKGDKFKDWTIKPQEGDYVTFYKYEGSFAKINSVECQWLQDAYIMGIVPDPTICNYNSSVGN